MDKVVHGENIFIEEELLHTFNLPKLPDFSDKGWNDAESRWDL